MKVSIKSLAMLPMLIAPPTATAANVCFMLYQMADNNLEYFLRQDNYEVTLSDIVRKPSVTTWIYFDHRNYGTGEDIFTPLQNVYDYDGSVITGTKTTRSQYLTWNHAYDKMTVWGTSTKELDGDNPQTVYSFMVTALEDCITKGATEYFMAFSSHGGGFQGFGGDDHTRRHLLLSNQNLIGAVKQALGNVAGAPDKLDVVGFDACLMQAFGSADEMRDIAKYLLASEANEPGHGWAYNVLTDGDTALGLAKDIVSNFLSEKQGNVHKTPKTLALVDLDLFSAFLGKWESLCAEMKQLLVSQDPELFTHLNRARASAISFWGALDGDSQQPSALDIGDMMRLIREGCAPLAGSGFSSLLEDAQNAYDAMFVKRGVGEGTEAATGMHITWPVRLEYHGQKSAFDQYLFDTTRPYATTDAPEWLGFLKTYYATSTPPAGENSVCANRVETTVENVSEGQLIINPTISGIVNGGHQFTTEIARAVDEVWVEFGIDLTPIMRRRDRRLQHLQETVQNNAEIMLNRQQNAMPAPRTFLGTRPPFHHQPASRWSEEKHRNLRPGDYFILFGGDVAGTYFQSKFSAFWDRTFYTLEATADEFEAAYVYDTGAGSKYIPVIYMPPNNPITSEEVQSVLGFDELTFLYTFGGVAGFLSFSTDNAFDGVVDEGMVLFTFDWFSFSEMPRKAGGQIIPVVYGEGRINGVDLSVFVGGFSSTVIEWNEASTLKIHVESVEAFVEGVEEVETLIFDVYAFDYYTFLQSLTKESQFVSYELMVDGSSAFKAGSEGIVPGKAGGGTSGAATGHSAFSAAVLSFSALISALIVVV